MKARNLFKTIAASVLLSSAFAAASASADNGYVSVAFGDYNGYRVQHHDAGHDGYQPYRHYDTHTGHHVDRVQFEQRNRIQNGIRSGELTPREAARLIAEQREIERLQHIYMSDGRLAPRERQRLLAELDEASRNIWRQKHDAQDRDDFRSPWRAHH